MAMFGGQIAVTGTAVSLASALSITDPAKFRAKQIILASEQSNTDITYYGLSDVTTTTNRLGQVPVTVKLPLILGPFDAWDLQIDKLFVVGTPGNTLLVTIIF